MSRDSPVPRSGRCPWGCVTVPPHGDWNLGLNNMIIHTLCINVDVYLVWTFIIITMLYIQPIHSPIGSVPLWVQCPSCIWSSFWTVSWNGLGWCVSLAWSALRHSSFGWGSDPCFHVPYLWKLHCVSGDLGHLDIDFILGLTSWCWSHGDCVLLIWCILDIIPPWVLRFQAWVSGYSVCWCPLRPVMTRFHPWPCRWHYWWGSHLHRWYTH